MQIYYRGLRGMVNCKKNLTKLHLISMCRCSFIKSSQGNAQFKKSLKGVMAQAFCGSLPRKVTDIKIRGMRLKRLLTNKKI